MTTGIRHISLATTLLSWVSGYADTAGFLRLDGLFTAHVTGNLIIAGVEIAGTNGEAVWVRLAVILVFIAAVGLTTLITRTRRPRLSRLLWLETLCLLLFAVVGVLVLPNQTTELLPLNMFMVGSAGVFAMGIQNALMRESLGTLAQTTVMTGNLTQLTIDATRKILIRDYRKVENSSAQEREIQQRLVKFGGAVVGFILGAAFGAFFMRIIGFWSILLPVLAVALLAFDTQQHETA
ncbi:MAG TPA: YoaK family protein [Coleofasciculaceae cyanobacterium]